MSEKPLPRERRGGVAGAILTLVDALAASIGTPTPSITRPTPSVMAPASTGIATSARLTPLLSVSCTLTLESASRVIPTSVVMPPRPVRTMPPTILLLLAGSTSSESERAPRGSLNSDDVRIPGPLTR